MKISHFIIIIFCFETKYAGKQNCRHKITCWIPLFGLLNFKTHLGFSSSRSTHTLWICESIVRCFLLCVYILLFYLYTQHNLKSLFNFGFLQYMIYYYFSIILFFSNFFERLFSWIFAINLFNFGKKLFELKWRKLKDNHKKLKRNTIKKRSVVIWFNSTICVVARLCFFAKAK